MDNSKIESRLKHANHIAEYHGIDVTEYIEKISNGHKWCVKCKNWHNISYFGRDRARSDGLNASCRKSYRWPHNPNKTHPKGMLGKHHNLDTRKKMSLSHSGNKNHKWKGGITPSIRRARQCAEYYRWREMVFERDNWICQKCFIRGGDLHAHHIKSFKKHPSLRYEKSNGKTLHVECHKEVHAEEKCHTKAA